MILQKKQIFLLAIITIFTLTGCLNQESPTEKIFEVLEQVVEAEKVFEEQQDPLVSLEKEEKTLYDKIGSLSMKNQSEIITLSDEALQMVDKRKSLIEKEQKSMMASKKEFLKVKELLKELKEPKQTKQAQLLYKTMMQRYDAHDTLFNDYIESLNDDRELYQLFKKENVTLDQLESQVKKLNESYQAVFKANEAFNNLTKKYNKEKLVFYEESGLKLKK
jgi:hypothetical protein